MRNAANDLAFAAVGVELQVRGGAEDGGVRDGRDVHLRLRLLREEGLGCGILGHVRKGTNITSSEN